ncbi:unnamed protein product [Rotaria sordida]|uniref:Glycoside hydrolase 35 catalytic domain-containing protein n=1 Tax=Rotaria sordida TaxID=392033 RepID=A0A820CBZ7_9BILA|nr:unnamed protein product [Rotaria sordida]
MVMEYYPDWIDYEGQHHRAIDSNIFAEGVDKILKYNGSINFYMVFGGTNFQFTNGSDRTLAYHPIITFYDYNAIITECGDAYPTKFKAVRDVIAKYLPLPTNPNTGVITKSYGYILYSAQLKNFIGLGEPLLLSWIQDQGVVLLDEMVQGVLEWTEKDPLTLINSNFLKTNPNSILDILMENKGRCCSVLPNLGCNFKGMKSKPRLGPRELGN